MDHTYRIEQANDIPDAPPANGKYDESAIRVGALELVVARQRNTIRAQRDEIEQLNRDLELIDSLACSVTEIHAKGIEALSAENARLLTCIKELEREAIEKPRGFEMTEREFLQQRSIDDRHNSCEASWNGRIDN